MNKLLTYDQKSSSWAGLYFYYLCYLVRDFKTLYAFNTYMLFCTLGIPHQNGNVWYSQYCSSRWPCFALLVFLIQMALFCTLGIAHSDGPALHSVYFSSTWTCFALLVFLIRMALFCILGIPPTNGPDLHSWYSSYKWPCFSFLVFYIQMDLSCILGIHHPNRLVFAFSVFPIPMVLDYILSTSHPVYLQDRLGLRWATCKLCQFWNLLTLFNLFLRVHGKSINLGS